MIKRYKVPEGQKTLSDRILELLEVGPVTTLDLYQKFPEYKTTSLASAVRVLRERGHTIVTRTIGMTKRGRPIVQYTKVAL